MVEKEGKSSLVKNPVPVPTEENDNGSKESEEQEYSKEKEKEPLAKILSKKKQHMKTLAEFTKLYR